MDLSKRGTDYQRNTWIYILKRKKKEEWNKLNGAGASTMARKKDEGAIFEIMRSHVIERLTPII